MLLICYIRRATANQECHQLIQSGMQSREKLENMYSRAGEGQETLN